MQVQFVHPVTAWWIDTVLGTWEETLKALVREVNPLVGFETLSRSLQRHREMARKQGWQPRSPR